MQLSGTTPALDLRGATFGFGGHPVVGPVDLRIEPGQAIALTGANGSGKTTLATGLFGLAEHLAGEVEILGTPLHRLRDRTRLGYVPQHHSVATALHATVEEVVTAGRLPLLPWWRHPGSRDREAVREAVEAVGLGNRARQDIATLSGGQRRRALLARALVSHPELVVLDEPTAGVDVASQQVLAGLLGRLRAEGLTILVVTHELEPLRDMLDRVVRLADGRLVPATDGEDA
ncbi:metal ABC transporter ATP-binding protein [Kytococcus sp. Marseille-QA3725]